MRGKNEPLIAIQLKASEEGIPYHTLVPGIIHKYVSGSLIDVSASERMRPDPDKPRRRNGPLGFSMKSVTAEFERGSEWDSRLLLLGVLFVMGAFVSTFETEIWEGTDSWLLPLLATGVSLVALNILLRFIRPKLNVILFEIQDDVLEVRPVRNLQFSGWMASDPVTIEISEVSNVKAYDFYNIATKAGMHWVCLELKNKQVIEFYFDNPDLLGEIIEFVKLSLPGAELIVDPRLKT